MAQPRFPAPPSPSLPKEAPWREIEEIIELLRATAFKLDTFISIYTGAPPPTEIVVTPPAYPPLPALPPFPPTFDGRLDALVKFAGMPLEWGRATGGSKDRLNHLGKSWADDIWAGYEVAIIEGTGAGQVRRIKTNDRTSLTPQTDFDTNPDNTTVYVIRTGRAVLVNKPAWTHGQMNVASAGTAKQLPSVEIPDGCQLTIIAKTGNTGYIYLGKSKTDAESTTSRWDGLSAGLAVSLKVDNANRVFVDSSVSGEGISYLVEQVS